jgi:hypothetical protein
MMGERLYRLKPKFKGAHILNRKSSFAAGCSHFRRRLASP